MTRFFQNRWRSLLAAILGVVVGVLARRLGLLLGASTLIGWNLAAATYVLITGWLLLTSDETTVRTKAKDEDENRAILMSLVLAAVGVSFGAIIVALKESKQQHGQPPWVVALCVSTLVLSWLVVQCLYTVHYAHRYFGDRDSDGQTDGGLKFPGAEPTSYRDFIYVAVCIGATCQVSDFNVVTSKFRNLVTTHAALSFVFNTLVLALGINIVGNLMGQ